MSESLFDVFTDGMTPQERARYDRALVEAEAKFDRAVRRRCPFGRCIVDIDPLDGKIFGGMGDPYCGCDNLPGWRSKHYDGLPKPGWTGNARGRHGSRVQRSHRRRVAWQAFARTPPTD